MPVLLVGGGSGIVPLMSMVRHRRAAGETQPALLLYSARTASELLYHDELLAFDAHRDGFTLVTTLTRERALRPGDYDRRIDNRMMSEVLRRLAHRPANAFMCGTNAFVNAAADGAIAAGIREDAISHRALRDVGQRAVPAIGKDQRILGAHQHVALAAVRFQFVRIEHANSTATVIDDPCSLQDARGARNRRAANAQHARKKFLRQSKLVVAGTIAASASASGRRSFAKSNAARYRLPIAQAR